jgi:hypothetical protein
MLIDATRSLVLLVDAQARLASAERDAGTPAFKEILPLVR